MQCVSKWPHAGTRKGCVPKDPRDQVDFSHVCKPAVGHFKAHRTAGNQGVHSAHNRIGSGSSPGPATTMFRVEPSTRLRTMTA